eukprot:CAMPEP_0119203896 /NCGR_PEP_ID=MMETSP1316-20130426/35872_1 /TAXON_ID=41880 /ORGANISM="Pycnococcus provasolii, Strain RCC2336" /LENGTH=107 /DNA_ID=CAMNT_0007200177 /DNA_START=177 /DNA_END=502 /DNA_ORIENTATION=-
MAIVPSLAAEVQLGGFGEAFSQIACRSSLGFTEFPSTVTYGVPGRARPMYAVSFAIFIAQQRRPDRGSTSEELTGPTENQMHTAVDGVDVTCSLRRRLGADDKQRRA